MRILVTGASGLLGLNLALETAREHQVFGTVNTHAIGNEAFDVIQNNLLVPGSVERLLDATHPDWVINCAALADLDACEADPALARKSNTELPAELATHVARGGARLVHISTDAVFDGQRGGYTEEDSPNPLGIYAQTKFQAELAVAATNPEAIVARVNLFGWSLSGRRSLAEFFFNNLRDGNLVMGFTDIYFCPLLVNDIAGIFIKMLDKGLAGLYHVVSRDSMTKYDFGVTIARRFGLNAELIAPKSVLDSGLKAVRSPNLTLKVDKLIQALAEDLPTISTGIDGFYKLYQQNYPQFLQGLGDS